MSERFTDFKNDLPRRLEMTHPPEYVRQSCLYCIRGIIWEVEGRRTGSLPLPSACPEEPGLCCHFWFMDAHICKWAAVHGLFPSKLGGNRFFNQPWDSYTMRWQFRTCGVISIMGPEWVGIQMKANMLCFCTCCNMSFSHTHTHTMPKLGSWEVCEGPEHAACGYGLTKPFQPMVSRWAVGWPEEHPNCHQILRCQGCYRASLLSHWLRNIQKCVLTLVTCTGPLHSPEKSDIHVFALKNAACGKEWGPGVHLFLSFQGFL